MIVGLMILLAVAMTLIAVSAFVRRRNSGLLLSYESINHLLLKCSKVNEC